MFRHVLLATDFSEASDRALDVAMGLARAVRARVTVLHVYETGDVTSPGGAAAAERTWPGAIRARAGVERAVGRLGARGVSAHGILRFGLLPDAIVEVAHEVGADLIVTGTRARKGLARAWHGSVAEGVVRHSPIPVLTAAPVPTGVPRDGGAVSREAEMPDNVIRLRRR